MKNKAKIFITIFIGLFFALSAYTDTVIFPERIGTGTPTSGYVLTSNGANTLASWQLSSAGSMVYPGAGIALSTGTAWGTSITNNSANWDTAYGWGNHASAGYLSSLTVDAPLTGAGTSASHLSIQDAYLLNNGDVGTGVYDFGGATSFEIPNTAGDLTLNASGQIAVDTTNKQLGIYDGTREVAIPLRHLMQGTFDLAGQYDVDSDLWLADLHADSFPNGIVITAWYVDATPADPTTELNANLMYCDAVAGGAFPGANATLIDVIDTTTGNSSEATMSNSDLGSGTIPTGKSLYIDMDADPTDANTQYHLRIHYYIPES